jgi:glucose/mannose-6-phosphate isomerase
VWKDEYLKADSAGMMAKLATLPDQIVDGLELAREAWQPFAGRKPQAIVVAGMGGSAIGGELLRSYVRHRVRTPISVCSGYGLPGFVGGESLVVVSSYSGNTEEALACFEEAAGRGAAIGCITSGGELLLRAEKRSVPSVVLPAGFPPRAALGYSFSALLGLVWTLRLCPPDTGGVDECLATLRQLREVYSSPQSKTNKAVSIAEGLMGTMPLIYCSDGLAAVGLRWKNQLCENSKKMAFASYLPEMSHNDIMGWEVGDSHPEVGVILLRTPDDHQGIASRLDFLKGLIKDDSCFLEEIWSTGTSLLSRLFSLILLGDYVSVYIALMRGLDPTPIATIERMKSWIKNR